MYCTHTYTLYSHYNIVITIAIIITMSVITFCTVKLVSHLRGKSIHLHETIKNRMAIINHILLHLR